MALKPSDYVDGWVDAYYNWVHYGKMPEPDTHTNLYYQGFDGGWKYATQHVSVIMKDGHLVADTKASSYIDGWIIGGHARYRGLLPSMVEEQHTLDFTRGFYAGYDAPDGALPP